MAVPIRFPLAELLLTMVSVTLLAVLLFIWIGEYRRTRARFTLGLVLFASVFLLKDLIRVLQVIGRAQDVPVIGPRVGALVALAEVVALAMLLYLVSR